ncbi:MAG: GNAT family N-acetyltransferase [Candidatus Omnitrophota bacterium]|jgi:predicted N-acyltransferase
MGEQGLKFSIVNSITEIPYSGWQQLFDPEAIEGYAYQKTLEESGLKEFTFLYLIARRGEKIAAIIPLFFNYFSFTTLVDGFFKKFILSVQKIFPRLFRMKLLFVGSPTAEEIYLGLSKEEKLEPLMSEALKQLYAYSKKNKIGLLLFYNLSAGNKTLSDCLKKNGFAQMEGFPNTRITIKAKSLEDYINGLGPSTRKDLRRKLRKSASLAELKTEDLDSISGIENDVYRLYRQNLEDSTVSFEDLTPEFFTNIFKNMAGVAKLFLIKEKDKIVSFNLCLIKNKTCIDKFIGFDREVSHKYHLYHVSFCHNIDYCIKNGIKTYQPGVTDYHPKVRLGAELIPLYYAIKAFNPLLNLFLKPALKILEPKRYDPVLRELSQRKTGVISPKS